MRLGLRASRSSGATHRHKQETGKVTVTVMEMKEVKGRKREAKKKIPPDCWKMEGRH